VAQRFPALNHPHICTLHDDGPDYLVMEYVEGAAPSGPMPVEEALRLARSGARQGDHVRLGEQDRGREVIQRLGSGEAYGASRGLAIYHICCGEIDLAADWFEKVIEDRYPNATAFLQGAIGEPLRASPRWPKLAALMNLPEAGDRSAGGLSFPGNSLKQRRAQIALA
jgi:hypothetical protein